MKVKKTPRLYTTLFNSGFISVVLAVVLAWFFISGQLTRYFIQDAVTHNSEISSSITAYIQNKLQEPITILMTIEDTLALYPDHDRDYNVLLKKVNDIVGSFDNIEIVDFQGKVIYTLPENEDEIGFDRSRESYFTQFYPSMDVYWSSSGLSADSSTQSIMIVIHSHLGFIVGYLDLSRIQDLSSTFITQFGNQIDVSITDEYGIFLVNKNVELVNERRMDPHHDMAIRIIDGENEYLHQEDDTNSILITSSEIKSTGWIVSISEPYQHAIKGIDVVIQFLILFIIIMLSAFALMLQWGNNRVIVDIKNFSQKLFKVSEGTEHETGKSYFKEFETLNNAFNVMVEKIDDRDKQLQDIAYHDALTGFYNRAYLDELVRTTLSQTDQKYAVVYLDMDNFSHVNDTYGHHIGDLLLIEFSLALKESINPDIEIIRLGGDEFILLIKSESGVEKVTRECMHKITAITHEPMVCGERSIYFTLSAGVSFHPADGQDFWTLLRNADTAMYTAKADGKNTVSYFKKSMNEPVEKRLSVEQHLRPSMKLNEFSLEFQPQISIDQTIIRGFEALVRWDSKILGRVSPIDFIGVAEENKMIIPLGRWVMSNACKKISEINHRFGSQFIMAVNVSPVELKESDYAQNVLDIIKRSGIDPTWLEIEITENISIDVFSRLIQNLKTIHEFGISISIDDFGTGYSSLAYLQKIPLDILKVDRTFITHIGEVSDHNLMTETIFLMAKKLTLKTVAEGVETKQHIDFLRKMECDYMQGYFISKPLNYDSLLKFIENNLIKNPDIVEKP